jgi:hypothetical protein
VQLWQDRDVEKGIQPVYLDVLALHEEVEVPAHLGPGGEVVLVACEYTLGVCLQGAAMARTMTTDGARLIIHLRPFESLTGLASFKTHVKKVTIQEIPEGWSAIEAELDEYNRQKFIWFPHGSVAIYKERPA